MAAAAAARALLAACTLQRAAGSRTAQAFTAAGVVAARQQVRERRRRTRGNERRGARAGSPRRRAAGDPLLRPRDRARAQAFSSASEDVVAKLFSEKFAKIQKWQDSVKEIPVPLSGDDKAVAEYAKKLDALRSKAGVPSTLEQIALKMSQISVETPDDITQAEFFAKAESYREQLGLPKNTLDEIGSALQEMNKKLDAAKTAADKTKIAKEYHDKFAAMQKVRRAPAPSRGAADGRRGGADADPGNPVASPRYRS